MPYIDRNRRAYLDDGGDPQTAADLDYLFAKIIDEYHAANGLRFEKIAEVLAALESTKLEYYRRIAAPYEQIKASENGDVFLKTVALLLQARPVLSQTGGALAEANAEADARAEQEARAAAQTPRENAPVEGVRGIEGGGFS